MSELIVEGPFTVPYTTNMKIKRVSKPEGISFWNTSAVQHLANKQGCYIFAIRAGRGFTPWYVGKAGTGKRKKGFASEIFTPSKLVNYNDALHSTIRGTPVMFFVSRAGNSRVIPNKDIAQMETFLIQNAVGKNPNLTNTANTKNLPKWSIKGVIRSSPGKPKTHEKSFVNMMGI